MSALLWTGCWGSSPVPRTTTSADDLPSDITQLMAVAEQRLSAASSAGDFERAAAALDKARELLGETISDVDLMEVHWKLAYACFMVSELHRDASAQRAWLNEGRDAAVAAVRERPDRVEGYYYLAVIDGRRAESAGLTGLGMVKEVQANGLKAAELAPGFLDGGPLRLLAMLHAKTPPWPTSIGDIDLALEYAQQALQIADTPMNNLVYAEVLIEAEEYSKAKKRLRRVLSAPKIGTWAQEGERWRPHARQLLKRIESHR